MMLSFINFLRRQGTIVSNCQNQCRLLGCCGRSCSLTSFLAFWLLTRIQIALLYILTQDRPKFYFRLLPSRWLRVNRAIAFLGAFESSLFKDAALLHAAVWGHRSGTWLIPATPLSISCSLQLEVFSIERSRRSRYCPPSCPFRSALLILAHAAEELFDGFLIGAEDHTLVRFWLVTI